VVVVGAVVIVIVLGLEVLPEKLLSPAYLAASVWLPTGNWTNWSSRDPALFKVKVPGTLDGGGL
jgi:hypothetical protein